MYTTVNFKTKKALREAVEKYNRYQEYKAAGPGSIGAVLTTKEFPFPPQPVQIYSPGFFPPKTDGEEFVEGPHYPASHTWYATVTLKNRIVIAVR